MVEDERHGQLIKAHIRSKHGSSVIHKRHALLLTECFQFPQIPFLIPNKAQSMPCSGRNDQLFGAFAGFIIFHAHPKRNILIIVAMVENDRHPTMLHCCNGRTFLQIKASIQPCAQTYKRIQHFGREMQLFHHFVYDLSGRGEAAIRQHAHHILRQRLSGGRQHRRSYRESLDCAVALQELQAMGVENTVTFDAHDPRVCNAVPMMGFDNLMPSYQVMKAMFRSIPDLIVDRDHLMVVSPDEGALNRNMYYAVNMGVEMGMFYKRRDYSRVVNGRNPIVAHEYLGTSVEGKDIFIADDIIASGESMLDIAYELKKRKANRIFAYATYAIFTAGLDKFDKAVKDGILDGVFGTNLTYRTPELLKREWFHEVDCSKYVAYYIAALNHNISISQLIDSHSKIQALLEKHRG